MKQFEPTLTIINSTVPPGTTKKIHELVEGYIVHSPIRGMHFNKRTMKRDLLFWTKYIGGVDIKSAMIANTHFKELGLKTKILDSSTDTELAKLFSTTYRAWMIACFQELHRISRNFEADFNQITDFLEDIHRVRFDRPLHFPGVIGGHCLIPNSELLLESYDSEFIKLILKSNKKRKNEIEDPIIAREAKEIRDRVEAFYAEISKFGSESKQF
jgi:UDP-N-acetyl-D-mannosaminuronate dehydrogenase